MKILALEKHAEKVSLEDFAPFLRAETLKVLELIEKDKIRDIHFSENKTAVIIMECADKAEAKQLLDTLPLVEEGFISFDLIEMRPYTGFSRLANS